MHCLRHYCPAIVFLCGIGSHTRLQLTCAKHHHQAGAVVPITPSLPIRPNDSSQQQVISPLPGRHILKLDTRRVLAPGRQDLPNIKIADIDLPILGALTLVDAATQDLKIHVWVGCEEERQGIPLMPSPVPDAMDRRRKLPVGLPLEILSDITDERARLWRRIDPDPVLVEDLKRGDRILENKCQP